MAERHIVAMGGGGFSMEPRNPRLDDFVLSLARRKRRPRVCFVGTASGDSDLYIRRFHEAFPLVARRGDSPDILRAHGSRPQDVRHGGYRHRMSAAAAART